MTDFTLVIAALSEQGFYRSGERLIAPNGTLWLSRAMLECAGLDGLRGEASRRLRRKLHQRKSYESIHDWQCAVEDAESLLAALDQLPVPSARRSTSAPGWSTLRSTTMEYVVASAP